MWPHCSFFISCPVGLCHCNVDLLNHIEKIGILAKKKKKKLFKMFDTAPSVSGVTVKYTLRLKCLCFGLNVCYAEFSRNELLRYHYWTHLLLYYVHIHTHKHTPARTHTQKEREANRLRNMSYKGKDLKRTKKRTHFHYVVYKTTTTTSCT